MAYSDTVIELISPFPPEKCVARLQAAIDFEGVFAWFGSKPVVGRIWGKSVCLRKRIWYRNMFQTQLTGILEPHGDGTKFRGAAAMESSAKVFMVIWFCGVILIGGPVFVCAVVGLLVDGQTVGLIVPPSMVAFGFLLVFFGRYLARDEEKFLKGFLANALSAEFRSLD